MTLRTERIRTLDEVRAFLEGGERVGFTRNDRGSAYVFVRRSLEKLRHHRLRKPDKGLVKAYLAKVTGLSRAQLTRLIARHRRTGHIRDRRRKPRPTPSSAVTRPGTPPSRPRSTTPATGSRDPPPRRSSVDRAASRSATASGSSPPPTTSSSPSTAPKTSSGPASPSRTSTASPPEASCGYPLRGWRRGRPSRTSPRR